MVYLISYDLKEKDSESYQDLFTEIELLGSHTHCLESTWAVDSILNAKQIYGRLNTKIGENDKILISECGGSSWRLEEIDSDWFTKHL